MERSFVTHEIESFDRKKNVKGINEENLRVLFCTPTMAYEQVEQRGQKLITKYTLIKLLSLFFYTTFSNQLKSLLIIYIALRMADIEIEQDGCLTDSENDDVTSKVDLSSWSEGDGGVQDESEAGWEFVLDEDTGESRWSAEELLMEEKVDGEESGDQE